VAGAKLEKLISSSLIIESSPIFNLPYKIYMIVKPKLYKWKIMIKLCFRIGYNL
jgi:hypothetical protein